MASEASIKLEADVRFGFDDLGAVDLRQRASAWVQLRQAGMDEATLMSA